LAETFAVLEQTSSRREMVSVLAAFFRELDTVEIQPSIYLLQGRLGPSYDTPQFGISEKLTARAVSTFTEVPIARIETSYRRLGDFGLVAEALMPPAAARRRAGTRPRRTALTVVNVFAGLDRLARASGAGSIERKVSALAALLEQAEPVEARYLVRIPLGQLRIGVGDATVMDALAVAREGTTTLRPVIERAYNLCSDLGLVAATLYKSGPKALARFRVQVGRPIKMQFAERAGSIDFIVQKMGVCAVEPKFDGFRCQVHKNGTLIRIFSRNQEDTTSMFPDVVTAARSRFRAKRAIFEGEALGYDPDSGELHPFQVTVQRKRKHGIDELSASVPLRLNAFDVLYVDGRDLTPSTYRHRRTLLEKNVRPDPALAVAPMLKSGDTKQIQRFFDEQISQGLEGIVAKRLDSRYEAGKRNFNWIKFKRAYHGALRDTLDLAIVGYYAGRGKRAALGIGAILGAVYDSKADRFRTLARVASGLSDAAWVALRKRLEKTAVNRRPARVDSRAEPTYWVEPSIVVEVFADEITRSPVHTAGMGEDELDGYALRFPRIVGAGVREDRAPEDATLEREVERLFALQKRARVAG
jgi:DNA ligase-1